MSAQVKIGEALAQLAVLIKQAVREEQLIDHLTSLRNNEALDEWVQTQIDEDNRFWVAFIEVDRFKSINDKFGYDAADEMLRRIAAQLQNAANSFFLPAAVAFRAHGDEFYLAGSGDPEVARGLEQLRATIQLLRVQAPEGSPSTDVMSCTVSTGWITSEDFIESGKLTTRLVRTNLEAAVADAKVERDCVVKWNPAMQKTRFRSGRADCSSCRTKFSLEVPSDDRQGGVLACPNCRARITRPPSLLIEERT